MSADAPTILATSGGLRPAQRTPWEIGELTEYAIDVSGVTYNRDRTVGPTGQTVPRSRNPLWQKDLMTYLLGAQAAITTRSAVDGLTRGDLAVLARRGILYRGNGVTVYG